MTFYHEIIKVWIVEKKYFQHLPLYYILYIILSEDVPLLVIKGRKRKQYNGL